jgi:hypothetical protein
MGEMKKCTCQPWRERIAGKVVKRHEEYCALTIV